MAGIVFVLIGSGATIMTNLGPLAQSLNLDSTSSTIVSNGAQTMGRLGLHFFSSEILRYILIYEGYNHVYFLSAILHNNW